MEIISVLYQFQFTEITLLLSCVELIFVIDGRCPFITMRGISLQGEGEDLQSRCAECDAVWH